MDDHRKSIPQRPHQPYYDPSDPPFPPVVLFDHSSHSLLQRLVPTVLLLAFGYLAFRLYDSRTSQLSPYLQDWVVSLVPPRLILVVEQCLYTIGHLSHSAPRLTTGDLRNHAGKSAALEQLLESFRRPVLRIIYQARKMSPSSICRSVLSEARIGPPGLKNDDYLQCYGNSVIQALASLPSYVKYIRHAASEMNSPEEKHNTINELNLLFTAFADAGMQFNKTLELQPKLKLIDSKRQEDVSEYLQKIIEAVETEYVESIKAKSMKLGLVTVRKRKFNKLENNEKVADKSITARSDAASYKQTACSLPATDSAPPTPPKPKQVERLPNPLEGLERYTKTCPDCGTSEHSCPPFNFIALLPDEDSRGCGSKFLIDRYTKESVIDGESDCDTCTHRAAHQRVLAAIRDNNKSSSSGSDVVRKKFEPVKVKKSAQTTFARLPQNLVFYVSRTRFDRHRGGIVKNRASYQPSEITRVASKWCDPTLPFKDKQREGTIYQLKSVIVHEGTHAYSGHYFAFAKRGEKWYKFNDETVTECDIADVTKDEYGGTSMFFYERTVTPPVPDAVGIPATPLDTPPVGTDAVKVDPLKVSLSKVPIEEEAQVVEHAPEDNKPTPASYAQAIDTSSAAPVENNDEADVKDTVNSTIITPPESIEMSRTTSISSFSSSASDSTAPTDESLPPAAVEPVPAMRTALIPVAVPYPKTMMSDLKRQFGAKA